MLKLKIPYTYSIIFYPTAKTIGRVKIFKEKLKSKTEPFASQNSPAHITIAGFEASESQLLGVSEYLTKFVKNEVAFTALFDQVSFSFFSKSAVFLTSSYYQNKIHVITKKVRKMISVTKMSEIRDPHVSIGRELSEEQLKIAQEMFDNENLEFECFQLALRKFNSKRGQYDIIEKFLFTGKPNQGRSEQMTFDWDL